MHELLNHFVGISDAPLSFSATTTSPSSSSPSKTGKLYQYETAVLRHLVLLSSYTVKRAKLFSLNTLTIKCRTNNVILLDLSPRVTFSSLQIQLFYV